MADTNDAVLDAGAGKDRLSRVYAEALMQEATKANEVDLVGTELDAVVRDIIGAHPNIEAYLRSPVISRRQKEPVLERAFAGRSSNLVRALIGVLNKNGRLGQIRSVRAAYQRLREQQSGLIRVLVKSASPLDDGQREHLKSTLAAQLKGEPVLDVKVDPELLGGLVIQIGDRVYDMSVRTRLQSIRAQLMDGGTSYVLKN